MKTGSLQHFAQLTKPFPDFGLIETAYEEIESSLGDKTMVSMWDDDYCSLSDAILDAFDRGQRDYIEVEFYCDRVLSVATLKIIEIESDEPGRTMPFVDFIVSAVCLFDDGRSNEIIVHASIVNDYING